MDKRYAAAGAAGAAGMLCLLVLVLGVIPGISTASDPEPPNNPGPDEESVCGEEVHFFAGDVNNNFFGPAAEGDVAQLNNELHRRRCMDPALVVAHAHTWGVNGFKELSGDMAFVAKIRELRDNPELWRATVTELERVEAEATASVETMSGSYQTLYMLEGIEDVPLIRKAAPDKPAFQVLRFVRGDQVVNLKLDCGFQPVAQDFPGIPPVKEEPPPAPPPGSTTPPPPPTTASPPPTTEPGKDPSLEPSARGHVPEQVQGHAPPVTGPATTPAAGKPPKKYTPPPPPPSAPPTTRPGPPVTAPPTTAPPATAPPTTAPPTTETPPPR